MVARIASKRRQQAVVETARSYAVGEFAKFGDGAFELGDGAVDLGRAVRVQVALQPAQPHAGSDQPLLGAVVQVALQSSPLGDRRLDQPSPAGEQAEPQPGHLDRDRGGARQLPQPAPGARRVVRAVDPGDVVMRLVVGEDSVLFREGLVRLLADAGHDVLAAVGDADTMEAAVADLQPDVVIADIRMPPMLESDGARAAARIRVTCPEVGILLLSQHIELHECLDLVGTPGFGYLLKDRVLHLAEFDDALRRVAECGSAIDPAIVRSLVGREGPRHWTPSPLGRSKCSAWWPKGTPTPPSRPPCSCPSAP